MKIAIIVAMDKELKLILPLLQNSAQVQLGTNSYHTGTLGKYEVVVTKVGIGKVNAALGAAALIDTFHPALVLNTGVAGGTGNGATPLKQLDLIMPTEVAYHDVWCGPGTIHGQADGCPATFTCPLSDEIRSQLGAKSGLLASGDVFVDDTETLQRVLKNQPTAVAVDMESAAIAQTCHTRSVPFACIRVISDTPGDSGNAAEYSDFWTAAPERTFHAVEQLLQIL